MQKGEVPIWQEIHNFKYTLEILYESPQLSEANMFPFSQNMTETKIFKSSATCHSHLQSLYILSVPCGIVFLPVTCSLSQQ